MFNGLARMARCSQQHVGGVAMPRHPYMTTAWSGCRDGGIGGCDVNARSKWTSKRLRSTAAAAAVAPRGDVQSHPSALSQLEWSAGSVRCSFDSIIEDVVRVTHRGGNVHIGTDSRRYGGRSHAHQPKKTAVKGKGKGGIKSKTDAINQGGTAMFASVICLHIPGSGELARFYVTRGAQRFFGLDDRIMEEATRSMNLAIETQARVPDARICVHSDTSTDERWPSSRFTPTIRSWAMGLGFSFKAKPEAWAASCTADWHTF